MAGCCSSIVSRSKGRCDDVRLSLPGWFVERLPGSSGIHDTVIRPSSCIQSSDNKSVSQTLAGKAGISRSFDWSRESLVALTSNPFHNCRDYQCDIANPTLPEDTRSPK